MVHEVDGSVRRASGFDEVVEEHVVIEELLQKGLVQIRTRLHERELNSR